MDDTGPVTCAQTYVTIPRSGNTFAEGPIETEMTARGGAARERDKGIRGKGGGSKEAEREAKQRRDGVAIAV